MPDKHTRGCPPPGPALQMDAFSHRFAVPNTFEWAKLSQLALPGYIVKELPVTFVPFVFTVQNAAALAPNVLQGHLKMKEFLVKLLKSSFMAASLWFQPGLHRP